MLGVVGAALDRERPLTDLGEHVGGFENTRDAVERVPSLSRAQRAMTPAPTAICRARPGWRCSRAARRRSGPA